LECALERVQDAEEGAIALLDENAEIYQQAKNTVANIALLQRQLAKTKRSVTVGFAAGGVSFGVGVPLFIEGIQSDNRTMMWAGAGTAAGGAIVWAVGHYVFKWW
jgi:pyridoxal biosynthesis lyase PdxS